MGAYDKAEPLHLQALEINRKVLGEDHPDYATSLHNLAFFHAEQEKYEMAWELSGKALAIREKQIDQIFSFTSEKGKLNFLESIEHEVDFYFSLVRKLSHKPGVIESAFDLLLRQKNNVLDSLIAQREAGLFRENPQARKLFHQLDHHRQQFARISFKGPDPKNPSSYKMNLNALKEKIEDLGGSIKRNL